MFKIITFAIVLIFSSTAFAGDFKVTIKNTENGFFSNKQVLNGFGCSGENLSPEIHWENPPEGTKSFVVTMYDLDAPTGSGWWHWVVANIPLDVRGLKEGAGSLNALMPKGAGNYNTDFGKPGYGGPCPPQGRTHRYVISVFALKVEKLGVTPSATGAMSGFFTRMNSIAKAETTVLYKR